MSPSKGLWEVYGQSGGRKGIFYVDFAKKHAFLGSMISIAEKKNLSQERLSELNKIDVSEIPLQDALVMGNSNAKFKVIVFDDPD
jgi:thiol:disulfide interchange protein DsbC